MKVHRTCPNCQSTEVVSNKIYHKGDAGHAAHVLHKGAHSHPTLAAIAGAGYLIGKAIDQFTEDYKCTKCNHTFS